MKWKVRPARAKEREERSDSPDLQTAELQRHPITDPTGMILHVITAHLSQKETAKSDKPTCTAVTLDYHTTVKKKNICTFPVPITDWPTAQICKCYIFCGPVRFVARLTHALQYWRFDIIICNLYYLFETKGVQPTETLSTQNQSKKESPQYWQLLSYVVRKQHFLLPTKWKQVNFIPAQKLQIKYTVACYLLVKIQQRRSVIF